MGPALAGRGAAGVFWHAVRRASGWRTDRGTELFISFADLGGHPRVPDCEVASLRLTCFNGDLPSRLPFGLEDRSDFELPQSGAVRRVRCLVKPTAVVQPPLGKPLLWRLISALSLNHLSIVDDGRDASELENQHNQRSVINLVAYKLEELNLAMSTTSRDFR